MTVGDVDQVVSNADSVTAGKIEVATIAETNTGTSQTTAVSPDGLDGWTGNSAALASYSATGLSAHAGSPSVHHSATITAGSIPGGWFSPAVADDGVWRYQAPAAMTIVALNCEATGGTMTLTFTDVASTVGTIVCANGSFARKTTLTDSSVAAQARQYMDITSITGSVTDFTLGWEYTIP